MCGIVGFQGAFDRALLDSMSAAVAHRGPDSAGTFITTCERRASTVGFGFRRLAIIDLSSEGDQPMTVGCDVCGSRALTDLALIFNGEIYNYRELRDGLLERGHRFHSASDSEVLLHLYAEAGLDMLRQLNGIFAFAIYDGREQGRPDGVERGDLFLARDQIGVKPLYYAALPEGVLFGSEIKALLRYPQLPRSLDLVALHYHLAYLWCPAPRTMLQAVKKLEPGAAIILRAGRVHRGWNYYDLPYGGPRLGGSSAQIAEQLWERLDTAVRRQLVSDVPVGAFLSGGLDSSSVVAAVRHAEPARQLTCYCIGFAGEVGVEDNPDDLPYARRVADYLKVDLVTIAVQPDIIGNLERMLYFLDEPQADPAPINALLIAEAARREGIKVLLSGAGGDDIFSGYRRHWAIRAERMWGWLPRPVRDPLAIAARRVGRGGSWWDTHNPNVRRFAKMFSFADASPDRRMVSYFWWSTEQLRRSLYSKDAAAALDESAVAQPLLDSLARIPSEHDPLNRMLYLEGKHFLADHNLNYTDRMGMAAGVEIRVPLLDLDMVDFATQIPPHLKQHGRVGKAIFKKAMEPYLPRDVIYREKSGFGVPLRRWLRNELREMVDETLGEQSLRHRGLFDPTAVRRLVELDRAGRIDGSYTIFALMCIELWCKLFIDAKPTTVPSMA